MAKTQPYEVATAIHAPEFKRTIQSTAITNRIVTKLFYTMNKTTTALLFTYKLPHTMHYF
ncbi:hypothetical protein N483_18430 [Pseudoalteromonas luteoviolacea NCIMB 1944]|nr:hypothetical protein N483_18430 [Pseudoalteromonas luteoviolacea NCIMB 1944]